MAFDAASLINVLNWQAYADPLPPPVPKHPPNVGTLRFVLEPTLALINRSQIAQGTIPAVVQSTVNVDSFGAVGDGVTDDSGAFQSALNSAANFVDITPTKKYAINTSLTIPFGTFLIGTINPGDVTNGNGTAQSILPQLILGTGVTINLSIGSGIQGIHLVASGVSLAPAQNLQASTNNISAFHGTALTLNNAAHSTVRDMVISGFSQAIDCEGTGRFSIRNVFWDCTAGILINNMHDIGQIEDCNGQVYLTSFPAGSFNTISNCTNNGSGLIRVTVNTGSGSNALLSGMTIWITGVTGTTEANNRWVITNVTATTVDLVGSTFANNYISGGTVFQNTAFRSGDAYKVTNSEAPQFSNCFEYGHNVGYHISTGVTWALFTNCASDDVLSTNDPNSINILVDNTAQGVTWCGGYTSSKGTALKYAATGFQSNFVGVNFNANGNVNSNLINIIQGQVVFSGCSSNSSGNTVIGSAVTRVIISGCDFHASGIGYSGNQAQVNTLITGSVFNNQSNIVLNKNQILNYGFSPINGFVNGSSTASIIFGTPPVASNYIGLYFGSSVPTSSAPAGSLYLRADGNTSSTRMYVNSSNGNAWVGVLTTA